ncbi:neo-calmodulin-like [Branchiostoma floridae x Branchiostoma japonicum]
MWRTAKKVLPPIEKREETEKLEELFDFSTEQIAEFKESFSGYEDSNGAVNVNQIGEVLERVGQNCTNDQLTDLMERADLDKTEKINFLEFLTVMEKRTEKTDASVVISEAFRTFDTNGDGHLSVEELRHVMTCLGQPMTDEEVENMIRLADMEGDGKINYAEFTAMMSSDEYD